MKTTKPENFQKLLDELRSGERRQGANALRIVEMGVTGVEVVSDCCLGVACDISGLGRWEPVEESLQRAYVTREGRSTDLLPRPVLDWLGILPEDAFAHPLGGEHYNLRIPPAPVNETADEREPQTVETAAEANDGGLTFSEIADLLEQEYMS